MQRIVIDTNVLVSALIQQSYPYLIVSNIFLDANIEWCISDPVLEEYHEVLNRAKFSKYHDFTFRAESLLASIDALAKKYSPQASLKIIKDAGDNKFLELAAESDSRFLITGNTADFTMVSYKQTQIVTPKVYWENHRHETL